MSTEELLARFQVEHFDRHSISEQRQEISLFTLRGLAAGMDGRSLAELTSGDLMAWQGAELKRGLAPNTMRNRESMVRAFLTWAYHAGVIDFENFVRLKSVPPVRGANARHQPRPYSRRELEDFREALAEKYPVAPMRGRNSRRLGRYLKGQTPFTGIVRTHARRLQVEAQVSLALECGLRLEEFFGIGPHQLATDAAAVVVLTAKGKPGERREREVPWTAHARLCVSEWLELRKLLAPPHERAWLALTWENPLAPQTYERCKKFLPGDYTWHRFRHTFATERLRAGMPLEQVSRLMGHANLQQTLAYAEIVNADIAREAARTDEQFQRNLGLEAA